MNTVLLTVSGEIDPQVEQKTARGERPRADYMAMARGFPADLIDYSSARKIGGWMGWLLERIGGPNLVLAWACFRQRQRYRVIFTDGEQVGLPLAFLLKFFCRKPPRHCMIAHRLSVRKKMLLLDWLGLHSHVDRFFVYCRWQADFIRRRWKISHERVIFTPFMVDDCFFSPSQTQALDDLQALRGAHPSMISSAGLEFRDYPTLIEAVRGLPVQVVLAAASPWSKRRDNTADNLLPENVTVRRFTQHELRALYAASQFVVMPLQPVDFQAGVTAILEAMAMGKAVICTRTPGQTDVVIDHVTGIYVEPGDPAMLRSAILYLIDHPAEAERLGRNSRQQIEREMNLNHYISRLRANIQDLLIEA